MPKLSYHLRWNNHLQNLQSLFENLYTEQSLVDVTMSCSDGLLSAHKLVLSACSPYFEHIFKMNPCKHPIIILRGIKRNVMRILLEYMYAGSVNVVEEDLEVLLSVATELQIKGLMQSTADQSDPLYQNIVQKTNHFTKDITRVSSTPPVSKGADNLKWQAELVAQPSGSKPKGRESGTEQLRHLDETCGSSPDETCTDNIQDSHFEESESGLEVFPCDPNGEQILPKEEVIDDCSFDELYQEEESIESVTEPAEAPQHVFETKPTDGNFLCKKCNRSFQNKVAHQRHMMTHSGIKPHSCTFCNQSFLRLSHLQRHIRVHTGERPYACLKCPKQFARSDKLRQHYIFHHDDAKVAKVSKPRGRPRKHFEFYPVPPEQQGQHPHLFPEVLMSPAKSRGVHSSTPSRPKLY